MRLDYTHRLNLVKWSKRNPNNRLSKYGSYNILVKFSHLWIIRSFQIGKKITFFFSLNDSENLKGDQSIFVVRIRMRRMRMWNVSILKYINKVNEGFISWYSLFSVRFPWCGMVLLLPVVCCSIYIIRFRATFNELTTYICLAVV